MQKTEVPQQKSMGYYFHPALPPSESWADREISVWSLYLERAPADMMDNLTELPENADNTHTNNSPLEKELHAVFLPDMWKEKRKIPCIVSTFRLLKK